MVNLNFFDFYISIMWLSKLTLINFRSYRQLEITLPPSTIILRGDNARGKTNLLEAVYMTATTRSSRASDEVELPQFLLPVQSKSTLAATCGLNQAPLLVVADRPHRRTGPPSQVADAHQFLTCPLL